MNQSKNKGVDYKKLMGNALLKIESLESQLKTLENKHKEPIAIIGMSCRFPGGANSPEAFWEILNQGVDTISEVPQDRWNLNEYYDPNPDVPGKIITPYGGFVSQQQVDSFDANFFSISAREVISLDPQQRVLLEVSWEAIERANIHPDNLLDTQTGVFIGVCTSDYLFCVDSMEELSAYWGTGNALSAAAGRLSYLLGLTGPSIIVDTACSSSLVSVHLACQSIRNGECDFALAGGVNFLVSPEKSIAFSKAKMLSPDGRCKTFDAAANGYVRGEGCGIILLKRLSDAVANGDNILAVIRGSAINQDGASGGLTVPNGPSQQKVIRQALENGGVDAASVSYIEAHGTGTSLGDPIEVGAIGAVFGKAHSKEQPVTIGTVKTNIGHLEGGAGIAGLMKVVLQMQNQQIAPSLHFNQPNPYINWSELPVEVSTKLTPWETNGKSRIAGVSSFGFTGTNAHIVLAEAPTEVRSQKSEVRSEDFLERSFHILTLSAKTEKALLELVSSYQNHITNHPELKIGDICYTANIGRAEFNHRLALLASNEKELSEKLGKYKAEGKLHTTSVSGTFSRELPNNATTPKIAFLFTGQGSQYVNMAKQLYQEAPVFRAALDECDKILGSLNGKSIKEIIYSEDTETSTLNQTANTQPAIFAIEYALFQLWQSWGIKPDVVMGHSVGEYVAATVAGVFSLEDGLKLISARGSLMQQLPEGGEMVSLIASESKVESAISPYAEKVAIAAINGPESTVISGEVEAVRAIVGSLESEGIKTKQLQVSHAFHSPLMEPMLAEWEAVANQISYNQPRIPVISNVTGTTADGNIATAKYWVAHVRQPVRFAQGMKTLHELGYEVFVEIGPKPVLLGMGRECLMGTKGQKLWLPSLRSGKPDWVQILESLAQLYIQGVKINWLGFDRDYPRQKVVLPTYPWQRRRYWITDLQKYQKPVVSEPEKVQKQVQSNGKDNAEKVKIRLLSLNAVSTPKVKYVPQERPKIKLVETKVNYTKAESGIIPQEKLKPVTPMKSEANTSNIPVVTSMNNNVDFNQIKETLKQKLADALYVDSSEIVEDQKFVDLGLDSIVGVEWVTTLNRHYGLDIKATKLYDYPTLLELTNYIAQTLSKQEQAPGVVTEIEPKIETSAPKPTTTTTTSLQVNVSEIKQVLKQKLADALYVDPSEIVEDQKFIDLGLDSIVGVEWVSAINKHYGLEIKATKLYDYPTLLELTNYIAEILSTEQKQVPGEIPQIKTETKESASYSEEKIKEELRSILNRVAKKELSAQVANQMIQELKQKLKNKGKKEEVSEQLKPQPKNDGKEQKVLEVIIKYTREVAPELEKVPLGPTHSLKNLGIDSASRAEIIMMIMEEFSLNIPRIELAGANNIGELAEIFAAKL